MWLHPQTKDNMMAIFTVGPNSTYPTIAAAMATAGPGDTIQLEAGYSSETAVVTHSGMIITGEVECAWRGSRHSAGSPG